MESNAMPCDRIVCILICHPHRDETTLNEREIHVGDGASLLNLDVFSCHSSPLRGCFVEEHVILACRQVCQYVLPLSICTDGTVCGCWVESLARNPKSLDGCARCSCYHPSLDPAFSLERERQAFRACRHTESTYLCVTRAKDAQACLASFGKIRQSELSVRVCPCAGSRNAVSL